MKNKTAMTWEKWQSLTSEEKEAARDYSGLDPMFKPFYESGERVEVTYKDGFGIFIGYGMKHDGKGRFFVGRSTGWKPTYIMILNRNSTCGIAIDSEGIKSVRGLGVYR